MPIDLLEYRLRREAEGTWPPEDDGKDYWRSRRPRDPTPSHRDPPEGTIKPRPPAITKECSICHVDLDVCVHGPTYELTETGYLMHGWDLDYDPGND